MKKNPPLTIIYKSPDELIPYVNNARTHSDDQVTQIASSIKEFGFNNPILLDGGDGVIAGHGRLMAAKKLGLESVPCVELKGLSETQKKAYILADNKIALNSGWDYDLLRTEFEDLKVQDFDLDVSGFSFDEITDILEANTNGDDEDIDFLDEINTTYNITIVCENLDQAQELNDRLRLDLDLTRQVLKRKFSEIHL